MIYNKDGKEYLLLNLEKQVQKNKDDIEFIINQEGALNQFGLRVVGQVENISDMPTIQAYKQSNPKWEYGDAFMVGKSINESTVVDVDKATLLVLTRANTVYANDFWMNLGEFPKPGPKCDNGDKGEKGDKGDKGLGVTQGAGEPTGNAENGTTYINSSNGDVYLRAGSTWVLTGNIRGPQGIRGDAGPQGNRGPIGPQGSAGPQGPRGIGVNILGTLTSTAQLPEPSTVAKDSAYIIPSGGINHLWVIEGTDNLVWTDFGTAGIGEKGDKGDAGRGIDTLTSVDLTYGNAAVTYNATDGINVKGTARFAYTDGNHDSAMDISIPIVSGEGITVAKKASEEKVEVKLDKTFTDGKYVPKTNTPWRMYVTDGSGNQSTVNYTYLADWNAVVQRDAGGKAQINTPEAPKDIANKMYVDDNFVAKTSTAGVVYATDDNGAQKAIPYSALMVNKSLALRDAGGHVNVATPVSLSHATTKAYVDANDRYLHNILLMADDGFNASFAFASSSRVAVATLAELPQAFMAANGEHYDGSASHNIIGVTPSGVNDSIAYSFVDAHAVVENQIAVSAYTLSDTVY